MPHLSSTVASVPASGIRRIYDLAQGLDDVLDLTVGEPSMPVAPHILEAGAKAWLDDVTHYTPNSGIPALRAAIVDKLARFTGVEVDLSQVHVTAGGMQALQTAMAMALSPGDEILVPNPGYSNFPMTARLVGGVPVPYPLLPEHGFVPDPAAVEALVTPRTRALLVNSPSNPLGVTYDEDVLRALLDVARRHDLWVISDEVYEYLDWGGDFTSLTALDTDHRVLGVFSLSKTYALTGARVGYLVTPPGLDERFRASQEASVSCVNAPAQLAALAALTGPQDAIEQARERYRATLAAAREVLDGLGIRYLVPGGAFYLWIDVSHVSGGDVAAWCEELLLTRGVAVAPGSTFGSLGEGWVRACYAGDQDVVTAALARFPAP
ncbi:aminotransferase class I/II-fold pyridoxal phosphate-dependent enzyme [Nocardioides sp. GY 10127]|uniref:pyridoxal phosphate-dependent aminotransferase n=1 Tax=Nocardioides sp. GY 10127 TaxID=2569762 RepID=UPI0010A8BC73|nr:aminotransferase class I/II-fold pyridoxal phosphate-dependent enzyme [Nocardioides sp. GY 10127]TIC86411.1 aminotransferase class I/II-fold pyridoxal phosphate-dependent enzyme [Nocardioides sp. GY 10127]